MLIEHLGIYRGIPYDDFKEHLEHTFTKIKGTTNCNNAVFMQNQYILSVVKTDWCLFIPVVYYALLWPNNTHSASCFNPTVD